MLPTTLAGARTHNLKGVDLTLAPGEVVVITGVSGSGKSSLAIDTLYAEGQRRFVESFSPYARQFLERLERPPMDRLEPVPAGIAVDRRAPIKSSRSTVATMADLEPYLSALFTREALPVCPDHALEAITLDSSSAAERAAIEFHGIGESQAIVTYPLRVGGVEAYLEVREQLLRDGYRRLWVGGKAEDVDRVKPSAALAGAAGLEVVVDRVTVARDRKRLAAGIETAWQRSGGIARLHANGRHVVLQSGLACPECGTELAAARPGLFSYESPLGACPTCRGFGRTLGIDLEKVFPDHELTLEDGAIRPWRGKSTKWERGELIKLCKRHDVSMHLAWKRVPEKQRRLILRGDGSWEEGMFPGVMGWFEWLETRTYKMHVRVLLSRYRSYDQCHDCGGKRLNKDALGYRVGSMNLAEWHALEIATARQRVDALKARTGQGELARKELSTRLGYLERVGLGYLTLDRQARTLSGGEAQRVTLTAALGTSLNNALFVLDEPTVGLHPSDIEPLTKMLRELSQRNNLVLVVEHDPAVIRSADRVIELGPGAGSEGGAIVFDGTPEAAGGAPGATARALAGKTARRSPREAWAWLGVRNARANNLRSLDVQIPLGIVCAVTGPSGSGKSTLAADIVYRALARRFGALGVEAPGAHDGIDGAKAVRRVALVDQSPLGRTSRGNAATYSKAWDSIRTAYAREPEALALGLSASHFSFNVEGGRCDACNGEGYETVEMQFLADVSLICPVCKGKRFKDHVLRVRRRGTSIAELLEATVDQALQLFRDDSGVVRALGPVTRLGLGYLRLGQPLSTLSGGEAQRLKLARALADEHDGALYVLDEPSAGLHADEVERLLDAFDAIVQGGGGVLVVEHDLDVINSADWVIDLGPGAGHDGGALVGCGTPAQIAALDTRTGRALSARLRVPRPAKRSNGAAPRAGESRGPAALSVVRAREHNLKDISITIPHGALTVVTGPSGSGKSTLAFDVVFAEGQRRFLETLTPYARQFLPTMPRPDVDSVAGVPPSIALEQRTARAGAKSTVATVTEVAHYLRLLYAKLGVPHCPDHQKPIGAMSPDVIFAALGKLKGRHTLLSPVVEARKGTYLDVFTAAAREGIKSARCDGALVSTDSPPRLAKTKEHTIDLVIGEQMEPAKLDRETLDRALRWGKSAIKLVDASGTERRFSTTSACPVCGFSLPELDPRWFSFATRQGRCETCDGSGVIEEPKRKPRWPWRRKKKRELAPGTCPDCEGTRLAPVPRAVRLQGEAYPAMTSRSVHSARESIERWRFTGDERLIAGPIIEELRRRLQFLGDVGLDYLSLDRSAGSLSGGEMQRLRLAAQLGAGLTGALYVLDEPTIGLHPRDTSLLLRNLRRLVQIGSTVVVVEHDADTIRAADHLVDLGPGGGSHGGRVVAAGTPADVLCIDASPTGRALAKAPEIRTPLTIGRDAECLVLGGASEHNLRGVELRIPLRRFTVVAGVSGSGKSTLVRRVLLPALREKLGLETDPAGAHDSLSGWQPLKRAVHVDQSPIGRTPRSVPATFLGIWDVLRPLFASTPEAKVLGFDARRFSFNTPNGGRCTVCEGQGVITHEMSFLPDVVAPCTACGGKRFEPRTLDVRYMGHSIGDVLGLTAEQAAELFKNHPNVAHPLRTLTDMGAGYITLGQGSHTLSGGEAQRLKLAAELTATTRHEPTLYVLDEPTTGLHLADVSKLMKVLGQLVERGDTLVVIEHHPVVIAGADWVVELGPGGGEHGGKVVASGPPRTVGRRNTPTGAVLASLFARADC